MKQEKTVTKKSQCVGLSMKNVNSQSKELGRRADQQEFSRLISELQNQVLGRDKDMGGS